MKIIIVLKLRHAKIVLNKDTLINIVNSKNLIEKGHIATSCFRRCDLCNEQSH